MGTIVLVALFLVLFALFSIIAASYKKSSLAQFVLKVYREGSTIHQILIYSFDEKIIVKNDV